MVTILSLETATEVCSVALSQNDSIVAMEESAGNNIHSSQLTLFIEKVMRQAGMVLKDVDAIAVSMGPGSYTGLRIGVSAAKGLCYSLDKPLIGISTLKAMAKLALMKKEESVTKASLLCPMIDARRMEVYTAMYDASLKEIHPPDALILAEDTFADHSDSIIAIFGNGADKCIDLYRHKPNIVFSSIRSSAESVALLAFEEYRQSHFEDVAYFEPSYLKDFIAGKPRVKGLY
jgi:tRNA threonylcarbamoyladenosine biosynthesis protein TsaB